MQKTNVKKSKRKKMKRRFPDYSLPFSEFYSEEQCLLFNKLLKSDVPEAIAKSVIDSGYFMRNDNGPVFDSYYSSMWALQGQFPFNHFTSLLNNQPLLTPEEKKVSVIRSTDEMLQILRADAHSNHCLENGSLSFRGQVTEYFTKRPIPNPSLANKSGQERLLIPSIYRKYKENFQNRIMDEKPHEVFNTIIADDLIYYGMESPAVLSQRNHEKYGPHTISDLEDFPEPENQEYYKRWSQIKVQGSAYPDIAIISQHYGFHSYGLDITFDPKVAAFFSTNKFERQTNGKADYFPIKSGEHEGVIYCFYFRAPQITSTRDIINSIPAFEYIKPIRPIRQSGALPFFLPDRFNEANQFIWHIFKLHAEFNTDDLPSKEFLFPSQHEDRFYKAAIEVKKENKFWSDFVEYDF